MTRIKALYLTCLILITFSGCTNDTPPAIVLPTQISATVLPTQIPADVLPREPPPSTPPLPSCAPFTQTAGLPQTPTEYTVEIVNTFPHDSQAFTQGLLYHDGQFIEGTGLRGQSTVRKVEVESGIVEISVPIEATQFGEGTAVLGQSLVQLTWQAGIAYVYDVDTLTQIGSFQYAGEGWGLTTDGQCFIMSNGSSQIVYRDPDTFEPVGTLDVIDGTGPVVRLNELEYIDTEIWANIWQTNQIARIDPQSGQVTGWIDVTPLVEQVQPTRSGAVPNGIAYDEVNGRIYLTGKLWPTVFEVNIIEK